MGQDLEIIEKMYDSVASAYAELFAADHEHKPKDREILQRFAREIGSRRPVWDLGCGPGQTARYVKDLGVDISGLDLSEEMLAQARALHLDIPFRKGNMLGLDFADNTVAGIVAFYAIVHFTKEQTAAAFREVFRVLRPGGLFLCTYHVGDGAIHLDAFLGRAVAIDIMFFPTGWIAETLAACGFEKIDFTERDPYPDVEYESRRAYVFAVKPS